MEYSEFILIVNSSSVIILSIMAIIMLTATRFRGESGYAAAIIVIPNVPVYIYNMSRMLGWHNLSLFMFPITFSVNTLLMPLLWFFAKKNFDPNFKFKPIYLLHLLPCIAFLVLSLSMSSEDILANIQHEMKGEDTWIGNINTIIVFVQMVAYFTAIFLFLHRTKKKIGDTVSDAEWLQKEWIVVFEYLFAVLFTIVMVCYAIWPRTDAWLIQILNLVAMFYLIYNTIAHPTIHLKQQTEVITTEEVTNETIEPETPAITTMSEEQMKEICEKALNYMTESKAYLRPDISLALFAKEMKISQRTLSRAINGYMGYNFFEFVNRMRVEEAKLLLLKLDLKDYNIDSIISDCGFRSRSTFYMVFKKLTGKTPVAWLEEQ